MQEIYIFYRLGTLAAPVRQVMAVLPRLIPGHVIQLLRSNKCTKKAGIWMQMDTVIPYLCHLHSYAGHLPTFVRKNINRKRQMCQ